MRNPRPHLAVSYLEAGVPPAAGHVSFEQLLQLLRPEMLRFAQWLARDAAIAEDIVQESLLRAWRARTGLKDASAARSWLLTIVRREHARLYERKRLELVSLEDGIEPDGASPAVADDELHELRRGILLLPLEYREPLVMQVLGGFSTEEIASELALSSSAVLTRLFRARNKLRDIYGVGHGAAQPGAAETDEASR
jgi:RNA polymerase sigma-70 factor (ECF subfamily)